MIQLSWPETILLAALVVVSGRLFRIRFGKVWRTVRGSKPDADFRLQPIARRIRDFLWEVMLQGKVIRQRPLPGLAHAFVFWGFCAFALVTVNDFASGFGLRFLSPESGFGHFY